MGDNVEVDPADVRLAGEHVDAHASNFLAAHVAAHERIAAAQGGFIGPAAVALAELVAHWTHETASHHRELYEHADNLRKAASNYETSDTDAGTIIDAAVSDLAERMGIGM